MKNKFLGILRTIVVSVLFVFIAGIALFAIIIPREFFPTIQDIKADFLTKAKELDIAKVPGKIYYCDTIGNLLSFKPSSDEVETLLVIDSMDIKAISPDGKSVILVYPSGNNKRRQLNCKVFWMSLDDDRMHFIIEQKVCNTASCFYTFVPNGSKIFLSFFDSLLHINIIADTSGNLVYLPEHICCFDQYGTQFIGNKNKQAPWFLFNLDNKELIMLDTILFPRESQLKLWKKDTIMVQIDNDENNHCRVIFVPAGCGLVDTSSYIGNKLDLMPMFSEPWIVSYKRKTVLYPFFERLKLYTFVYRRDSLLWETYDQELYDNVFILSPDGEYAFKYKGDSWASIDGSNCSGKLINLPGFDYFIGWLSN